MSEITWSASRGCSAAQTARNPSNAQLEREVAAARLRRPIFANKAPVGMRTAIARKQMERKRDEAAFPATTGCRPSRMPPANAAAIATAGNLMALFATSRAFRCEMFGGTDQ